MFHLFYLWTVNRLEIVILTDSLSINTGVVITYFQQTYPLAFQNEVTVVRQKDICPQAGKSCSALLHSLQAVSTFRSNWRRLGRL